MKYEPTIYLVNGHAYQSIPSAKAMRTRMLKYWGEPEVKILKVTEVEEILYERKVKTNG